MLRIKFKNFICALLLTKLTAFSLASMVFCSAGCSADNNGGNEDIWDATREIAEYSSEAREDLPSDEEILDDRATDGTEDNPAEESPCPSFGDVQQIFTRRCSSCHPGRDNYTYLTTHLDTIRRHVDSYHHIGGEDRERVLQWIDCGAPP